MTARDHPTFAHVITDPSPTLPDPATRAVGELHDLSNSNTTAVSWGATGTNPFLVDGVAAATLSVAAGATARVQNSGTKWVLIRSTNGRRIVSAKGVTDAAGNAVFNFVPPFATVPVVTNCVETAVADGTETRLTSVTVSSVTFNARRSPSVTVLGISVLSAPQPAVGFTIHMTAMEAG